MIAALRRFLLAALLAVGARGAEPTAPATAWWRGFEDPQLDTLVRETLAANPDLKTAAARLGVAQAALAAARAERRLNLDFGAHAERRYYNRAERKAGGLPDPALSLGLDAGYEVDLWGRLAHGVEAGAADLRASAEDAAALRLALTAEVATAWFTLRTNAVETDLLARRRENARTHLALLAARAAAGLADAAPAAERRALLADLDRESAALARERALLLHQLAALRGLRPESAPFPPIAPLVAASATPLPADLTTAVLARRPDVRAASARVAAQQARLGEARAAALPALKLSAEGLFSGKNLRELLRSGSLGGFIAAQLTAPLLDGGRRAARTESARAELDAVAQSYAALVVRVFQETADALTALESAQAGIRAAEAAQAARRQLSALAEARRAAGRTDRLAVLSAEAEELVASAELARARLAEIRAVILLGQTLGGDWPGPALAAVP